ncbi:hypothetical protein SLH46_12525 [Draconibacterium sp. IB214405]|uniref:hypothetical protein n=1 Tax=Draconibacterium sp. IB214405 TaxID=3097352 RepID=UPI002A115D44|nr:hypothetical protein [Draconibacterium sp. IB214405]MDX8340017.1 hypothetical protein [Draconibacterium sp. IB214405]
MIHLTITGNTTHLKSAEKKQPEAILRLGDELLAEKFFSEFPPTSDEIDSAINYTEEMLAPVEDRFVVDTDLYTDDSMALQIAGLAFNTSNEGKRIGVPVIELENVFFRLSEIVNGLPASQDVLPQSKQFAAYLLILREVMHHLGFERLEVEVSTNI